MRSRLIRPGHRLWFGFGLLLLAPLQAAEPSMAAAAREVAAVVSPENQRTMRTLSLHGSPYERGRQHGQYFHAEVAQLVSRWKESLAREMKQPAEEVIRQFLAATDFLSAIRRWTPELLDEVRGIAEGAGQPFDVMFAFQLGDELYAYFDRRAHEHCSAVGIMPVTTGPGWVAQNMDIEPIYDGFQTVLRIAGESGAPEQLVLSYPGLIGLNGMNDRPIAVACNTLFQLAASCDGLPQAFVVRGLLAQRSEEAALAFIRNIRHASGQNYILGTRERVFDLEASAHKVVDLKLSAGGTVFHTNHALANDDLKPWARRPASTSDTAVRLSALERRLATPVEAIRLDDILATLRSKDSEPHPVCRPVSAGGVVFSFAGVIMTLGDAPILEASPGPPDVNPMEQFTFSSPATPLAKDGTAGKQDVASFTMPPP